MIKREFYTPETIREYYRRLNHEYYSKLIKQTIVYDGRKGVWYDKRQQ